jgi:predicted O-linked N-acetylglucosamine transferase (SPINDLY family)
MHLHYDTRHDAGAIYREHLLFSKQYEAPLAGSIIPHSNECSLTRRLKIGYVSADFKKHSVAYFIEPVLARHRKEQVSVHCYADVGQGDEVTERLRGYADHWHSIVGMTDEQVAALIRSDGIDILIDLAGHTAQNRMLIFARKPAPVQVSWIGYPATTGLSAMDYKIVDGYTDPPGKTEQYYTEKLIRMPGSFLCYQPDKDSPAIETLPALTKGYITFGSFNNFAKVTPQVMDLWGDILKSVPGSRLVMKARSLADRPTRESVMERFIAKGVGGERVELLGWEPTTQSHLNTYNRIDIALDSFPYNGTTTTCEALWMGVPVVTLSGETHASCVGVSLLTNAGLPELIARTPEEYIALAVELANDVQRVESYRRELREKMTRSALCDAEGFTAQLEMHYRQIWETWCRSL